MRPEDILDAIGNADEAHIRSAGAARRRRLPRRARALAAAACAALVLAVGIDTLVRFEYLTAGCSAYPGVIIGNAYYYRVGHSGIWKYTPEEGASLHLSTYWEDGTLVNEYGLYFDRGRSLYVKAHDTGEVSRLYTADPLNSSHIGLDLEPDGTVIVTVYNKYDKLFSQLRLDGVTGEVLETVTPAADYSDLAVRYTQTVFQVGSRTVTLVPAESGIKEGPCILTENGVSLLPEGVSVSRYPNYVGDDLYFSVYDADPDPDTETVFLVRPDGTGRLLERPRYYYCGGSEQYLFYVDHSAGNGGEGYASAVGCYEIDTGEYWTLPQTGGAGIDIYDLATDGQVLYSSCPWEDAQTLWHIRYEGGRPASLELIDEDISR